MKIPDLNITSIPEEWLVLEAIVVVKALNAEGNVIYAQRCTEDLQTVEALGMIEYARIDLNDYLRAIICSSAESDDE